MTSFDVGVSLSLIVESYRTYDESHYPIIEQSVIEGDWDDSYLKALEGMEGMEGKLFNIFSYAVIADNTEAMEAVYSKNRFGIEGDLMYTMRKNDLEGVLSLDPNLMVSIRMACIYNNRYIIEGLINKSPICINRGLNMSANCGNLNLVRLFLEKGATAIPQALFEAIGSDEVVIVKELFPLVNWTNSQLEKMVNRSILYKSSQVLRYLLEEPSVIGLNFKPPVLNLRHSELTLGL